MATIRNLNQCWLRCMMSYSVTKPQWVNVNGSPRQQQNSPYMRNQLLGQMDIDSPLTGWAANCFCLKWLWPACLISLLLQSDNLPNKYQLQWQCDKLPLPLDKHHPIPHCLLFNIIFSCYMIDVRFYCGVIPVKTINLLAPERLEWQLDM